MKSQECRRCHEVKPLKDFYKRSDAKKVQAYSWCKVCQRKLTAAYAQARYATTWSQRLEKQYGVTAEQYHAMVKAQGGVCNICKRPPGKKRLAVDHCHRSKKVRALLCRHCNLLIGLAEDKPETLDAAAAYLRGHQ